jgi:phenol/toluene 2-monooxygenase (NADH) P1/A1
MSFELRTNTIEPRRASYDPLVERFGNKPATRYQEGSYGMQPVENFHYRPFWDPEHELYDPDYTALKLTDPYSYSDPRQYYYNTYVSARASDYDGFARTLKYVEDRQMFDRLPEAWHATVVGCLLPLRHYEAGAQLVSINACRFAWGTTIAQAAGYAAFDRIGNAQLLSMIGLTVGGGTAAKLHEAKELWLHEPHLQGLRQLVEEALVESDWVSAMIAIELVDAQLYPLMYRHLDERSVFQNAGAYSLLAMHFATWYADNQKWVTPLLKAWVSDPEHGDANRTALTGMVGKWLPQASAAVRKLAAAVDQHLTDGGSGVTADTLEVQVTKHYADLGIEVAG